MNKLLVFITLILCGAAIIFGNLHWNNKISAQGGKVTNVKDTGTLKEDFNNEVKGKDLSHYSKNLPKTLQEKINNASSSEEALKLVIYGKHASDQDGTWANSFITELKSVYGQNLFQVTLVSTSEKTTRDIINDKSFEEINELQPDIILFEPSMLKDNGVIGIENTLKNIHTMIDSWNDAKKDITIMIQPPNPLYSATYYPSEVSQLKDYSEKNNIVYLDHWENWPDLEDEKMKEYLTTDSKEPNEHGNKAWADYLINYFITK